MKLKLFNDFIFLADLFKLSAGLSIYVSYHDDFMLKLKKDMFVFNNQINALFFSIARLCPGRKISYCAAK